MNKIIIVVFAFILFSCTVIEQSHSNIIRIKGSDTMLLLNKKLAEEFMINHPGISIYVEGGGTETGVTSLINNNVEICAASRPLQPNEIKKLGERFSTVGMSFLIGRDALSIYINPENPVKNLTLEQIEKIFTCQITNWKELGGIDEKINAITRSSTSGTNLYFINHVLKGEKICSDIPEANTTKEIIEYVIGNRASIGYGGIEFGDSTLHSSINGIMPTEENVLNNTYPISRYLRYYTSRKPAGNVKFFIDWVMGEEGQNLVSSMGYIPLWK